MPQTRRLAAIMFTDIVSYTALMGEDEQKAFEILRKSREIQQPIIQQFNGTWIKEIGDGVLASFPTVTEAVLCACAIQQASSQIPGLKLRIGIHQGEVVFENNDVFGDGVNIASRIQATAAPGSIYISESYKIIFPIKKKLQRVL
jgi:class 3 adenylate cyclase